MSRSGPSPMTVRRASRACSASGRCPTSSNSGASIPRIRTATSPDGVATVNVSPSITATSRPEAPSRSTRTAGMGGEVGVGVGDGVAVRAGVAVGAGVRVGVAVAVAVGVADGCAGSSEARSLPAAGVGAAVVGWLLVAVAARAVRRSTTVSSSVPSQAASTAVATAPAIRPRAIGARFRVPHQVVLVGRREVYCEGSGT